MTSYLRPYVPIPRTPYRPYVPNYGQTFDPIVNRANDQALATNQPVGGMGGNPAVTDQSPWWLPGFMRPGWNSRTWQVERPQAPLTNESARTGLQIDLANETDPARRARLAAFLNGGQAANPQAKIDRQRGLPHVNPPLDYLMSFGGNQARPQRIINRGPNQGTMGMINKGYG